MNSIVIFSGTAHQALAEEVCDHLNVPLSSSVTERFSNDCLQIKLEANCRECDVYIIQPLGPPVQENLMELLLMLVTARGASAARATAVIPYFSYSRSDKKDAPRISIAGRLVADLLGTAGADRILTLQLHSPQVHGFFSMPVDHLNAIKVLESHFKGWDLSNTVVVSPDLGNAKDATRFARLLGVPVAAGTKQRVSDEKVIIDMIVGDVEGKDVIATGGSIIELIERLKERHVKDIAVTCTHGVFSGKSIERFRAHPDINEIVTTNTVPIPEEKMLPHMTVLSVAPLLAEAIRRIHNGESVSSLFIDTL